MRCSELAKRNSKEIFRDPLSLGLTLALPVGLLLMLQSLERFGPTFSPTMLAPGIALFGYAMFVFSSGYLLARDRESSLLTRMLTTPLRPVDFIAAYALPYLPLALLQIAVLFGCGALVGLRIAGAPGPAVLTLLVMAVGYIGAGMILGSLLSSKQVGFAYTAILLPTIFSGAWMPMEVMGEGFRRVVYLFPFAHALDAARAVMVNGAGFADIAGDFLWVLGYSVLLMVLGIAAFRRKMVD